MPGAAGAWLVILVIVAPLLGALGAFVAPRIARLLVALCALAIVLGVLGLAWVLAADGPIRHTLGGWPAPLGIALYLDGLSLFMLFASASAGVAVCLYAVGYYRDKPTEAPWFWALWLLLWTAMNALFLSGDVFNLYVTLELMGLAAVLLVALAGSAEALSGAMRYLLVTMVASLTYLLGIGLLYHQAATLDIVLLGETLDPVATTWIALGLMLGALLVKSALFPLHFWLPFAHSSAPVPVSALLSALVVKTTIYLLVRLWLDVLPSRPPMAGSALAALGAGAILWGSVQALRQTELKLLVAYSTVAQVGYLFLPFAIADAEVAALAWRGAMFFLLCHTLAKAAMFMAVGNMAELAGGGRISDLRFTAAQVPVTVFAFGVAGITIIGLPPSGGFLAKWMLLEAGLMARQWWLAAVVALGGLLSAAYVFKVVGLAFTEEGGKETERGGAGYLEWVSLALALMTLLLGFAALPLLDLLQIGGPFGAPPDTPAGAGG